ncbi:MAG TPA: FtsX-like permease family protein [Rectinemataceae bacterium]|nr:FtsX-like permease family protein [Rectinemataceae bacterium]
MKTGAAFFLAGRMAGSAGLRGAPARHIRGAILGIALSLVPFVLVLLVADGMINGISSRYLETWSWHFQAETMGPESLAGNEAAAETLRRLPGVTAAYPEIRGAALAVHGGNSAPALLRGLEPSALKEAGMLRYLRLLQGDRTLSGNHALVGSETAHKLGLGVGDSFVVVTGSGSGMGAKTTILRVGGIVSAGYRDLDELWIFVPRQLADRILPVVARQDLIGIKVVDPYANPEADVLRFMKALSPDGNEGLGSTWIIRPWKDLERNLFASFETTRALLLVIMCISVLVAAANVSSALVMIVLERSRDIAIIKATGASPNFVALVFLLTGGGTGLLGSVFGVGLGALAAWKVNELIGGIEWILDVATGIWARIQGGRALPIHLLDTAYYLERIPVRLDPFELLAVAGLAILLSLLASTLPAIRAARLPPLEIMRKA